MTRFALVSMVGASLLAGGCTLGYADLVRRDQYGGVLALRGHRGQAMEDAQQQMAAHCANQYTIVSEENAVVGQQTSQNGNQQYYQNGTYAQQQQTTSDVTEYRITYQCGAAPPAAQGAPAIVQQVPPQAAAGYPQPQPAQQYPQTAPPAPAPQSAPVVQ